MKAKVTLNCGQVLDMDGIKGVVVRQKAKSQLETKSLNMLILKRKANAL